MLCRTQLGGFITNTSCSERNVPGSSIYPCQWNAAIPFHRLANATKYTASADAMPFEKARRTLRFGVRGG